MRDTSNAHRQFYLGLIIIMIIIIIIIIIIITCLNRMTISVIKNRYQYGSCIKINE